MVSDAYRKCKSQTQNKRIPKTERNPSHSFVLDIPQWVQKDIEPSKIFSPWSVQKRGYKHLDCSSKTSMEKILDFKGNEIVKKQLLSDYQKVSKKSSACE